MIREFLAAGLVDHMHIVVVPILLGRGVRLWDELEGLEKELQSGVRLVAQRSITRSRARLSESRGSMQLVRSDQLVNAPQ